MAGFNLDRVQYHILRVQRKSIHCPGMRPLRAEFQFQSLLPRSSGSVGRTLSTTFVEWSVTLSPRSLRRAAAAGEMRTLCLFLPCPAARRKSGARVEAFSEHINWQFVLKPVEGVRARMGAATSARAAYRARRRD